MRNTIRPSLSGKCLQAASIGLTLPVLMMPVLLATRTAKAQTYSVLYSFKGGTDGENPSGTVVRDGKGNLYGTTYFGGAHDRGTVYKVNKAGKETVLYSFQGAPDGANPITNLIMDSVGNLYGTTSCGGNGSCVNGQTPGCGAVFELSPKSGGDWKKTVLYSFAGGSADGQSPEAGLIMDKAGNLYSTTLTGGAQGYGTVFKLDTKLNETVLYNFGAFPDGESPGALLRDSVGNLYGTTFGGGARHLGSVFKLDTASNETILYSFKGGFQGETPNSGLIRHANGDLFGTTELGNQRAQGTIFKVSKAGKMTVLHRFEGSPDGTGPFAGLVQDKAGNFYGTTLAGGAFGPGTVFKLDTTGKETVLYSFDGSIVYPQALIVDKAGNLYGTTELGGNSDCNNPHYSTCGVVFKITP
jgi:uncharacterized repeat protein (TIGR03803 family)